MQASVPAAGAQPPGAVPATPAVPLSAPPSVPAAYDAFVARHGGRLLAEGPFGAQYQPADAAQTAPAGTPRLCPLPDLGLIVATGADADSFLHGQLTNDVEHLAADAAQWTGYCSPKGRLLATMLQWRETDAQVFALSRPLLEPTRKRLAMFVMRAKAKLADASETRVAFGLLGDAAAPLAALGVAVPAPMGVTRGGGCVAIGLPPVAGEARTLLWFDADHVPTALASLGATVAPAGTSDWRLAEVHAGVPRLFAATNGEFVPQMINFELVGGVNFKKGCYPGQEIVARSQYLGKLKRRMFAATSATEALPGDDVIPLAGGEPAGKVVMSAPDPAGGFALLFESQVGAVEAGGLRLPDGSGLTIVPLPYAVPAPGAA